MFYGANKNKMTELQRLNPFIDQTKPTYGLKFVDQNGLGEIIDTILSAQGRSFLKLDKFLTVTLLFCLKSPKY